MEGNIYYNLGTNIIILKGGALSASQRKRKAYSSLLRLTPLLLTPLDTPFTFLHPLQSSRLRTPRLKGQALLEPWY